MCREMLRPQSAYYIVANPLGQSAQTAGMLLGEDRLADDDFDFATSNAPVADG